MERACDLVRLTVAAVRGEVRPVTSVFDCRMIDVMPTTAEPMRAYVDRIVEQLHIGMADKGVDVVISTGGTGVTGRDVTPEAFESVYEKPIPGFGEMFRMISYDKIGTSTIQSRCTAGVAGGTYLFALPGSPGACKDGWDGILKSQLDYRFMPCNFVELMDRLQEYEKRSAS